MNPQAEEAILNRMRSKGKGNTAVIALRGMVDIVSNWLVDSDYLVRIGEDLVCQFIDGDRRRGEKIEGNFKIATDVRSLL